MKNALLFAVFSACLCIFDLQAGQTDDVAIANAVQLIHREAGEHRLILIGEMHGTKEVPQLIGALVSSYASTEPVELALEVHRSEQDALVRYLASDGSEKARAALKSGAFWTVRGTQHDGRRNEDVIDLIEHVRQLRAEGKRVSLLAIDNATNENADSQTRDKAMAGRVREAFAKLRHGRLLVLSGNVHAMLARPGNAPPEMQTPMGSYLRDLGAYSINVGANEGEFWACLSTCGPVAVSKNGSTSGRSDDGVYDLEIVLPEFTVARLLGAK